MTDPKPITPREMVLLACVTMTSGVAIGAAAAFMIGAGPIIVGAVASTLYYGWRLRRHVRD